MKDIFLEAVSQGLLSKQQKAGILKTKDIPCAFFYDLDAYDRNIKRLQKAFPSHFLHAAAVKANPLSWFMKHRKSLGLGAECATFEEVFLALDSGTDVNKIIFDSPAKTYQNINFVLSKGVHLNVDNIQELERVKGVINSLKQDGFKNEFSVGLRLNPLIGEGEIEVLSVSTDTSKFGVAFPSGDKLTAYQKETHNFVVNSLVDADFVTCIHVHCGSGGMGVKKLCQGIRIAVDCVLEVNKARKQKGSKKLINVLDIGGGIAVNFTDKYERGLVSLNSDVFSEYAEDLKAIVPEIFDKTVFKKVITEFGSSLNMSFGWFCSRVEYVKKYKRHNIVCLHGGSDIFLRHCYGSKKFSQNSIKIIDFENKDLKFNQKKKEEDKDCETYDFVGPLCFSGDVVLRNFRLPPKTVAQNDFVIILDTGANSFALKNMHCSKTMPPIYGYRRKESGINFEVLKEQESIEDIIKFWK